MRRRCSRARRWAARAAALALALLGLGLAGGGGGEELLAAAMAAWAGDGAGTGTGGDGNGAGTASGGGGEALGSGATAAGVAMGADGAECSSGAERSNGAAGLRALSNVSSYPASIPVLLSPEPCGPDAPFLLVLVPSAAAHAAQRQAVRDTWGGAAPPKRPRTPENTPKAPAKGSGTPPNAPRMPEAAARIPQNAPETPEIGPEMPRNASQSPATAAESPQNGPVTPENSPDISENNPETPETGPETHANAPKTLENGRKTPGNGPQTLANGPETRGNGPETPANGCKTPGNAPQTPANAPPNARAAPEPPPTRTIFVLGLPPPSVPAQALREESRLHGDLLQGAFPDAYGTLTLKTLLLLRWAASRCPGARFLLKADDDVFVNVPALARHLRGPALPERLYLGRVHWWVPPNRDPRSAHHVPAALYPRRRFPPYCSGTAYVLSRAAAAAVLAAAPRVPFVAPEDVWVGLCARRAGVAPRHSARVAGAMRVPLDGCCYGEVLFSAHRLRPEDMRRAWGALGEGCGAWGRVLGVARCR